MAILSPRTPRSMALSTPRTRRTPRTPASVHVEIEESETARLHSAPSVQRTSRRAAFLAASLVVCAVVGTVVFMTQRQPNHEAIRARLLQSAHADGRLSVRHLQDTSSDAEVQALFSLFVDKFQKSYQPGTQEYDSKFATFAGNVKHIAEKNATVEWNLDINQFADMTAQEFAATYGLRGTPPGPLPGKRRDIIRAPGDTATNTSGNYTWPDADGDGVADSVDWLAAGVLTPVENQGACSSCWSFSSLGALEALYKMETGEQVILSKQELIDCVSNNFGCSGGWPANAYDHIINKGGVATQDEYAYSARNGMCQGVGNFVAKMTDYQWVTSNDEDALAAAVAQQPVSVLLNAMGNFMFYSGGIMNSACGTTLDHAVLLVGYGEENGKKYWMVKNSWGKNWGENGYIRLKRTGGKTVGQCGIAMSTLYPMM